MPILNQTPGAPISFSERIPREEFFGLAQNPEQFQNILPAEQISQIAQWSHDPEYRKKLEIFYELVLREQSVYRLAAEQALVAFWFLFRSYGHLEQESFTEKVRFDAAEVEKGVLLPGNEAPVQPVTAEERAYGMLRQEMQRWSDEYASGKNASAGFSEAGADKMEESEEIGLNGPETLPPFFAVAGLELLKSGVDSTIPLRTKARVEEDEFLADSKTSKTELKPLKQDLALPQQNLTAPSTATVSENLTAAQYGEFQKKVQDDLSALKPVLISRVSSRTLPGILPQKKSSVYGKVLKTTGIVGAVFGGAAWASTAASAFF